MAIVRTTLQTIVGIAILLGILLWLFSPAGPLADPAELAPAGRLVPNRVRIMQMDWSSDASIGLSLSRGDVDGGTMVIWHKTAEDHGSQIVETGETQVWKAALAPDGKVAFVFGDSGSVSRIDLVSRERTSLFQVPLASALTEIATTPDGVTLAMAIEREIVLCDAATGHVIERLESSAADTHSIAFSSDGQRLAVGTHAGSVQVWDLETRSLTRHFSNHQGPVSAARFIPNLSRIVTVGLIDDTLQICDLESGTTLGQVATGHAGTRTLTISPDGRLAATGGNDRAIFLWDLQTLSRIGQFEGHSGVISALKFSADGRELLSAGDSTIRIWNVDSPSTPGEIESVVPFNGAR